MHRNKTLNFISLKVLRLDGKKLFIKWKQISNLQLIWSAQQTRQFRFFVRIARILFEFYFRLTIESNKTYKKFHPFWDRKVRIELNELFGFWQETELDNSMNRNIQWLCLEPKYFMEWWVRLTKLQLICWRITFSFFHFIKFHPIIPK